MPLHGSPRERRPERASKKLERLVLVAFAITLGRGNVAILGIVVLGRRGGGLVRFAAALAGKLPLLSGSAHDIPLMRTDRPLARHLIHRPDRDLTAFERHISRIGQSFLPFLLVQCKARRNRGMAWISMPSGYAPMGGNWFFERSCLDKQKR